MSLMQNMKAKVILPLTALVAIGCSGAKKTDETDMVKIMNGSRVPISDMRGNTYFAHNLDDGLGIDLIVSAMDMRVVYYSKEHKDQLKSRGMLNKDSKEMTPALADAYTALVYAQKVLQTAKDNFEYTNSQKK